MLEKHPWGEPIARQLHGYFQRTICQPSFNINFLLIKTIARLLLMVSAELDLRNVGLWHDRLELISCSSQYSSHRNVALSSARKASSTGKYKYILYSTVNTGWKTTPRSCRLEDDRICKTRRSYPFSKLARCMMFDIVQFSLHFAQISVPRFITNSSRVSLVAKTKPLALARSTWGLWSWSESLFVHDRTMSNMIKEMPGIWNS